MAIDLFKELTELRRAVLEMGASVEQRVDWSLDALLKHDIELAQLVRGRDDEIDDMEVQIEKECLRIFALAHPVAKDLRFVLAAIRMSSCLERIGDLARSIAKRAIDLHRQEPIELPGAILEMATQIRRMLGDVLRSLADRDAVLAQRVRHNDDRVDDLQKEVFAWIQEEIPQHPDETRVALDILSVARKLERIADMCTNIAEEVIFHAEGEVVRHTEE